MNGVVVARFDELAPGTARRVEVDGRPIALVRCGDGVYAIGDICSHANVSLSEGEVLCDELEIECWKHGSTFSIVDGEPQIAAGHPSRRRVRGRRARRRHRGDRPMSTLEIRGLRAGIEGKEILHGIDLTVGGGEVHAVMGPNGAGKSTLSAVVMGRPGYEVLEGTVTLDGVDVLALEPWERAAAGLYLAMQYPTEVPGVRLDAVLREALTSRGRGGEDLAGALVVEAERIGFDARFLDRALNVDLSGGEKKRNETLQLAILAPKIALLDELDSGLDVDALRACARRVEAMTHDSGLGVLAITHYSRLFRELKPDTVHILAKGRIVASGGPELADTLERDGYKAFVADEPAPATSRFAAGDPFADPFA